MALLNWEFLVPNGMLASSMPRSLSTGVLTLSTSGYLTISDLQGKAVWSSNSTPQAKASRASILDSGNFILLGVQNTSEIVWESFTNPTDHYLPTMKFWKGMKVNSWKSSVDPAPGPFYFQMDPSPGRNRFLLQYKNGVSYYRWAELTGGYNATIAKATGVSKTVYNTYKLTPETSSKLILIRTVLQRNGELSIYFWANNKWNLFRDNPQSSCGVYGQSGAYGVCFTPENIELCNCVQGFPPRDATAWRSQEWWSSGCVRRTPLDCINGSDTTDGFLQMSNTTLCDEESVQYSQESTPLECKTACLNNCSCMAFAFTNSIPAICKLWFGDLLSLQATSSLIQPLFIRLAASDMPQSPHNGGRNSRVVALSISIPLGAIMGTLFAWFIQRRRGRLLDYDTPIWLRTFTYKELKIATNNFAQKLGNGAFGCVFKGTLPDSTLVAVKKLKGGSSQAEKQFRAETGTIGNIHHVNLVRLWRFCAERSQRMLVFEYMQNGSLNSYLSRNSNEANIVNNNKRNERIFGYGVDLWPANHSEGRCIQLRHDPTRNIATKY
ncbi:G-type lectin S-receptor-like serine/threonine-protein kinase At2g19130 [Cryptomeria japonica]|uniref:G-type lectin S-receptor-like serine/threonine-protein kinase At2g19130 n=1 Tax=Cryptomeria japonica TaxID=3369 RepID=UPI0027DA6E41|nr:G-type lectin S-receptor-like serine/threonine-protein kinase At2g19130 [Cryptomeria japonica]